MVNPLYTYEDDHGTSWQDHLESFAEWLDDVAYKVRHLTYAESEDDLDYETLDTIEQMDRWTYTQIEDILSEFETDVREAEFEETATA